MVNYAYRNLFYKSQQTKDILIVDTDATVTPNSGGAPIVTDATVEIHTADIKIDSFNLDEKLCSADDLMKEGTLYPILHNLEKKGFVKAYNQQTDKGRSRRYYHLTDKGAAQLIEEKTQWEVFAGAVNNVLHCGV